MIVIYPMWRDALMQFPDHTTRERCESDGEDVMTSINFRPLVPLMKKKLVFTAMILERKILETRFNFRK